MLYVIIWLPLLIILDLINFRRFRNSLILGNPKHFFLIIIPLSAIYWLIYEFINLYFPQWQYAGVDLKIIPETIFSFLAFATVIPIIVEIFWLFSGPIKRPNISLKPLFSIIGIIFLILPFFSQNIWLNQLMWFAPFFIFLPWLKKEKEVISWKSFLIYGALAGLISGFLWEFFNSFAAGHWQYLVFPQMPHLFEMPILGYLGFIPFALGTIAIYLFAKEYIKSNIFNAFFLYLLAILLSFLFVSATL